MSDLTDTAFLALLNKRLRPEGLWGRITAVLLVWEKFDEDEVEEVLDEGKVIIGKQPGQWEHGLWEDSILKLITESQSSYELFGFPDDIRVVSAAGYAWDKTEAKEGPPDIPEPMFGLIISYAKMWAGDPGSFAPYMATETVMKIVEWVNLRGATRGMRKEAPR